MRNDFTRANALANLDRIIGGKSTRIQKAAEVESLVYEITEDRIWFPWLAMTRDADENKVYITFISKLTEQAWTADYILGVLLFFYDV